MEGGGEDSRQEERIEGPKSDAFEANRMRQGVSLVLKEAAMIVRRLKLIAGHPHLPRYL